MLSKRSRNNNKCKDDVHWKSDIVKEIPGGPSLLLPHLKTWGRISWEIGGVQSRALLGLLLAAGRRPQPRLLRARHVVAPLLPELPPALRGLCQPLPPPLLSGHQLPPLFNKLTCVTSLLKELLEPKERKEPGAQGEVGGQGEDEQQNREVDVEGVGDDGHHVHVAHHPGVRCLLLPVVNHMRVHVDEREEVQAQRRCEPAQESTREEQGVLVALMIRGEVVVVKDPDVEDGVVGADAHVADCQEGDHFNCTIVVVTLTSLDKERHQRQSWVLAEKGHL